MIFILIVPLWDGGVAQRQSIDLACMRPWVQFSALKKKRRSLEAFPELKISRK
jgi:hypothetical protein